MSAAESVNPHDLVPSVGIDFMCEQRAAAMVKIEQAAGVLADAASMLHAAQIDAPLISVIAKWDRSVAPVQHLGDFLAECQKQIDQSAWSYLMKQSGLRTFMDARARKEWDDQMEKRQFPEFNVENVANTFATIHGQRGELFERGVIEAFKGLSWHYATNSPCRFGKRIVYGYFASSCSGPNRWQHVNNTATDRLDDLTRCFSILDGKPEPDHRRAVYSAAYEAQQAKTYEFETEYLRVKWFKKGSAHIEFKRMDLVEKMNGIIAKHYPGALPPRI
ncbi:MAG: DUF4942 domain-containing protein [Bradyrhizobium sp.]|uniref:DUF4942 domain-containing protein n=1 Tax=Bradyrhizobium sp. TaxID=376 RepID=UPI003D0A9024